MSGKLKWLANAFLIAGVILGIITLFQISNLDLLNLTFDWIVFLALAFSTVLFVILGICLKCIDKQLNHEIQSLYEYYNKRIKELETEK